jgi:putative flippase GtrA
MYYKRNTALYAAEAEGLQIYVLPANIIMNICALLSNYLFNKEILAKFMQREVPLRGFFHNC